MKKISPKEYAHQISHLLAFLKEHKINQNNVSDRINYYSLSKAKNIIKYPQKIIEGKTRKEIYDQILTTYQVRYEEESDIFEGINGVFSKVKLKDESIYYILYYFSYAKQIVGKGLVNIKDKKWVSIDFNDPNHTSAFWKGTFEVIESYTFLYVEKRGETAPVKALYTFFSGTIKHGRPVLTGTYSTIKRDGSPTAGTVVLERVDNKSEGDSKINQNTNPRITAFLLNKNFTLETITPPTINDLPRLPLVKSLVSNFNVFWPYKDGQILHGVLSIFETAEVHAVFENQTYHGSSKITDDNTLYLELRNSISNRNLKSNNIHAYLNINNYSSKRGFIAGIVITRNLISIPASFPILLIRKGKKTSSNTIKKYFKSFSSPTTTALEPIELVSILES